LRLVEPDDFVDGFRAKGEFLCEVRTVSDFGHAARTTAGIASGAREHADDCAEARRITPDVGSGGA
jgi:hypothetical protein